MTKYEEILGNLNKTNPSQAEFMEEEIDIIRHKLKFLSSDSVPKVVILDENNHFTPINHPLWEEQVGIAGGTLSSHIDSAVQVIIILQTTNNLYQSLPAYLESLKPQKLRAILENKVFIIQTENFDFTDENYLSNVEILAEIIQSKYFVFGRNGEDWVKFDLL